MAELKPTPDLDRTRRNVLFATAVLLFVGLAHPETVKLPGFDGTELAAPVAIVCLQLAVVFFWWEYWIEYRLTRTRNSAMLETITNDSIENALSGFGSQVHQYQNHLTNAVHRSSEESNEILTMLKGEMSNRGRISADDIRGIVERFNGHVSQLFNLSQPPPSSERMQDWPQIRAAVDEIAKRLREDLRIAEHEMGVWKAKNSADNKVEEVVQSALDELTAVSASFNRVSDSVRGYQRFAFLWKDLLGLGCFSAAALSLGLLRIVQLAFAGKLERVDWWACGVLIAGGALGFLIAWRRTDQGEPPSET